jgi:hypothetical protein
MPRFVIQIPGAELTEEEREDLDLVFRDAMVEFVRLRDPVERYVDERYPLLEGDGGYSMRFRAWKLVELGRRVELAKRLVVALVDGP